ncbi:zinc-finger protein [Arachnomyces sp. PD_36]|nr:zinc-finger protein [Arachnomyces sp. PD_36]
MTGDNPMLSADITGQNPWNYPHMDETSHSHVPCELEEACCDGDDCSVQCSSVCDGFVGCDASTACSESHCDELDCDKVAPVCFDKNCIGDEHDAEQDLAGLLGQNEPFNWETDFLPSTTSATFDSLHSYDKFDDYTNPSGFSLSNNNFPSQSTTDAATSPDFSSLGFHPSTKDSNSHMSNNTYTSQNDFNTDMYDILGLNQNFSGCTHQNRGASTFPELNNSDKLYQFASALSQPQCQNQHQHTDSCFAIPMDPRRYQAQAQANMHHTHHNHYSVSSVSSTPLHSTPMETPPPQRSEISSPLTSPDTVPQDNAPTICRWVSKKDGSVSICGEILSGPGALQEHLVSKHMGTVDGAQGHGYYCRWEGCSRPNEPFSQKSKLQGHFLTHSNFSAAQRAAKHLLGRQHLNGTSEATEGINHINAKNAGKHSQIAKPICGHILVKNRSNANIQVAGLRQVIHQICPPTANEDTNAQPPAALKASPDLTS